ncbi:ATP-binding protein [Pontimonas sp.]|nr:ATP-binding protein [Pontimonas sp.]MDB4607088.1 ATP-binding protein [Pontimonas sp.]MDC0991647.1 ATP-binding protein [Pontimonas sp.]
MEIVFSPGWGVALGAGLGLLVAGLIWAAVGWQRRAEDVFEQPVPHGVDTALEVIGATGVVLDAEDRVLRAAQSAVALGLVTDRDVLYQPVLDLVRESRQEGVPLSAEFELPGETKSSPAIHLLVRVAPLGLRLMLVVADDQSEMYRVDAVRRDFVANISHELKTPIGAVSLLAEALQYSADDPEQVRSFAATLEKEGHRLAEMTSDIIELSKLQSLGTIRDPGIVSLDNVVEQAIATNAVLAEKSGITVAVSAHSGGLVMGDAPSLVSALHNLIRNAITYSQPSSRVGVGTSIKGSVVEVSVTDQGQGIAEADLERIFERFYRSDPARSRDTGGTGLGLAIVKHVINNHHGEVRVWSQLGKGSTFTIRLRRAPEEATLEDPVTGGDQGTPGRKTAAPRAAEYVATDEIPIVTGEHTVLPFEERQR